MLFIVYALLCLVAAALNDTHRQKRVVCWVCYWALVAGLVMDPLTQLTPPLVAYGLIALLNGVALACMPWVRAYVVIPLLFAAGVLLCAYGALGVYYQFHDAVPYGLVTHTLNVVQVVVLLGGSDGSIRAVSRYFATDSNHSVRRVHRHYHNRRFP